jgi:hypothetical protein
LLMDVRLGDDLGYMRFHASIVRRIDGISNRSCVAKVAPPADVLLRML